jgi:osmotically inducible lipoprotein OsmB
MKARTIGLKMAAALIALSVLGGCANMTPREKNTAIGAAVGGVAGSALTNGSAVGTVGGAAVGGYIGNQIRR